MCFWQLALPNSPATLSGFAGAPLNTRTQVAAVKPFSCRVGLVLQAEQVEKTSIFKIQDNFINPEGN